jgi:hypothetical protein
MRFGSQILASARLARSRPDACVIDVLSGGGSRCGSLYIAWARLPALKSSTSEAGGGCLAGIVIGHLRIV